MNHRFLNVSIMQHQLFLDMDLNLKTIEQSVESLMTGYVKPELVIGVEFGICKAVPITMEDDAIRFLSSIARKHGIYFIPGTLAEKAVGLPEGEFYNTCPVFAPDGSLIRTYRKKAPFRPGELSAPSGDDNYCIFEIAEKGIKVGVQICYDQFFPEIARTLALKGAELIVCPSLDPFEYKHIPEILPRARALENELYYIWTCGTGQFGPGTCCGSSVIVDPEGEIVFKCPEIPALVTKTLDFDAVMLKRAYGRDQHLNSLRYFNIQYPYAGKVGEAPVYKEIGELTKNKEEYQEKTAKINLGRN